MKAVPLLFAVLFGIAAGLQYNDPDAVFWLGFYAAVALICLASFRCTVPRCLLVAVAVAAGLWALLLLPGILSAGAFTGTEEEREFGGLLLSIGAMAVLWRRAGSAPKDQEIESA